MSDNWIILIPEDPQHIPAEKRQYEALARFLEIAPDSDEIKTNVFGEMQFFDCGANLERIQCPECNGNIPLDWWGEQMNEERTGPLERRPLPCCAAQKTLHELKYEWPQGFGLFSIEAMNPNIGRLKPQQQKELEKLLGCPLRVIYQHI